ncbi:MAG: NAD(P)/FAD-dependent oxidoreductase [Anaerolineae bacterium]
MFDFKVSDQKKKAGAEGGAYDVVVIGGGAAGLAAAIYAARDRLKTLVLDKEAAGGLAATTELIENYPGFPKGVQGSELMDLFREQAENFGAEIAEFEEVTEVEPVHKGLIRVRTTDAVYESKLVILATGSHPKKLNVPGEEEFYGRGVSYCATCDGPLFAGKDIVIIGAGNSGLQEGQHALSYVKSVTFIEFLPYSPAEKILQERTMNHEKSTFYFNHMVTEIKGDDRVTAVVMKDRETGEVKELPTDGVFIYVGYAPDTAFVEGLVELNERGYVKTDEKMRTNVEGILAAGDVRADNVAQVTVAVGDGTKAALTARDYIAELAEKE